MESNIRTISLVQIFATLVGPTWKGNFGHYQNLEWRLLRNKI